MKLSESIMPISHFKANAAEIINQVCDGGNPVVITQNGYAKVVVQDLKEYEREQERAAMLEVFRQGEEDIAAGRTAPADKVFARLRKEVKRKYPDCNL